MQDELSNAMKDFQFEPNMTFKEAGQLEIKNKPEEFPNNDQKEGLEIETIERKDENSFLGYEPKMALEIGQLEIENKSGPSMQVEDELEIMDDSEDELTVVRSNIMRDYSRGTLEIETIEMKDENSYEMEAQEDFELQLESDSDDDMNDNEIEPPTMDIKDDGKHFLGCSNQTQEPHNPLSLCLL